MASYLIAGFDRESGERSEEHRVADRAALTPIIGAQDPAADDFIPLTDEQARAIAAATGLPLVPEELEYFFELE